MCWSCTLVCEGEGLFFEPNSVQITIHNIIQIRDSVSWANIIPRNILYIQTKCGESSVEYGQNPHNIVLDLNNVMFFEFSNP